jgi:SAM-dependent methyltransferase
MASKASKIDAVRSIFRTLIPAPVRNSKVVTSLKRRLPHDWIYNSSYYSATVEEPAVQSAPQIVDSIVLSFKPKTVVDVGCGTGALLEALRDRGCDVFGLEYSEVGLEYCRNKRKLPVEKFDLEKDRLGGDRTFDVAVSLEVAEHLPEIAADKFVDILTSLAPQVVFTAAHPGQGGADHVNEQPASYWIAKFNQRGYQYVAELSTLWRKGWEASGEVASWYYENLMLFQKVS